MSDDEASAVLRGQTPEARQDLGFLADSVALFRVAIHGVSPQPSAEVAHRLDLDRLVSRPSGGMLPLASATPTATPRTARRARVLVTGFLGLGLAAKVVLGASAAVAVGVTGASVAGAAGVLPPAVQQEFDRITGNDIAAIADDGSDDGATVDHPGGNPSTTGVEMSEFGQETAEDARLKGEEARRPDGVTPGPGDKNSTGEESAEEAAENAGDKNPVRGDDGGMED